MKPFPAGLDVLLATREYVFCDLYEFTLADGSATLRYTTADTDVLYNGNVYTSKGPFFDSLQSRAMAHWKAGLDVDTWLVTIAPAAADPITGATYPAKILNHPWMSAARNGALDGAVVSVHRAYWAAWPTRPYTLTGIIPTTFDPAFLNALATMSPDNLQVTASAILGGNTTTRSIFSSNSAKLYSEYTMIAAPDEIGVGIITGAQTTATTFSVGLNGIQYSNSGNVFANTVILATLPTFTTGDVIGQAVDIPNRLIWWRKNGGNWNNNAANNPVTGVGGISFAGVNAGPYYAAVEVRVNSSASVNFGASAYSAAAPSGFSNWGSTGVTGTTTKLVPTYVLRDYFTGRVASVDMTRTEAHVTINSHMEILQRPFPREVYQAPCRFTLFDVGCTLNRATFAVAGTVTAVTDGRTFATNLAQAAGYFALGMLTWLTGNNAGFSRSIRTYPAVGSVVLISPMPYAIAPGDTFTAYPGCDKQLTTCTNKFSNAVNYGGQPFIPSPEVAV